MQTTNGNDAIVDQVMTELTTEEKVSLLSGQDVWRTASVKRLGLPSVKVTDGPNGARGDSTTGAKAVCLPASIGMAASFDRGLITEVGRLLGRETKRKGAQVILAPTINMARHPLGGRNFESFGEDPFLTGEMARVYIIGVQDEGVGACAKHFVANDTEDGRLTVTSRVDEQTLREVYLAPFLVAVEAGVWTIMAAYPRLNGQHCTENEWLLTTLLREEWDFSGLVMSDWGATHAAAASANAGLDLEMPGPARAFGAKLIDAVAAGEVSLGQLDERSRRVVELAVRALPMNMVSESKSESEPELKSGAPVDVDVDVDGDVERSMDLAEDRDLARRAASSGMVLLTNGPTEPGADALLPLSEEVASIAVIGPNAEPGVIQGGGSAQLPAHYQISPVQGLRLALPEASIEFHLGCRADRYLALIDPEMWIVPEGESAPFALEVFANPDLEGQAVIERRATSPAAFFHGKRRTMPDVDLWSQRWTGTLEVKVSGSHRFGVLAVGQSRVLVDGQLVADNWSDPQPGHAFFEKASEEVIGSVELEAGASVDVVVEWSSGADEDLAGLRFGYQPPVDDEGLMAEAVQAASDAEVAVVVVGLTAEWETESHDRVMFGLPGAQDELVRRVAQANPRTVVILNAGGPIDMPWLHEVPATVMAWYPGQEFGNALAEVLLGRTDPGGRLPVTFPKRIEDAPTFGRVPGDGVDLHYGEGLYVGHRWYSHHDIEPMLAFGHGLSYGEFELGEPSLKDRSNSKSGSDSDPSTLVSVPVYNRGVRAGKCVVQAYLQPGTPDRPRVLAGFEAIEMPGGAERTITLTIPRRVLEFWDASIGEWAPLGGHHQLEIGLSSDDIHAKVDLVVP